MSVIVDLFLYFGERQGAHRAGSLEFQTLSHIEEFLDTYFAGKTIRTAETGCGASTILFAHHASEHIVYTMDDTKLDNSSVDFARSFPNFPAERVKWIMGPTQKTLFSTPPTDPLDMVLIDGPHAYPFPELEYFSFYPHLKNGGVLVLDDIHIPTIRRLFDFIAEDDMFYLHSIMEKTAFFIRSEAPTFSSTGDDWWRQRYNIQNFPASKTKVGPAFEAGPIHLDGADMNGFLKRGFMPSNAGPESEGRLSLVELPFFEPRNGLHRLTMRLEPVFVESRPGAGADVYLQYAQVASLVFTDNAVRTLVLDVNLTDSMQLELRFNNLGLLPYDMLPHDTELTTVDQRLFNFRLLHVSLESL